MCYLNKPQLNKIQCDFYSQIAAYWNELHNASNATPNMLYNQILWYNSEILIDNKSVCYTSWFKRGINRLSDIMNEDGTFRDKVTIENQYDISISEME